MTPADALLDETEATISEGVREMACRMNQDASSFQKAADNLRRAAHIEVSKETLRRLVEGEGRAVLQAMRRAELSPDWSAADCTTAQGTTRVYVGCDGVKVPLITDVEKRKRRQAVREKRRRRGRKCQPLPPAKAGADNAYKEFKVGHLYNEQKDRRLVGVTAGNHEAAGRMLKRLANQVELSQAGERVALIDGAPWIRLRPCVFNGSVRLSPPPASFCGTLAKPFACDQPSVPSIGRHGVPTLLSKNELAGDLVGAGAAGP